MQTKPLAEGHLNIQKERRKLTMIKIANIIFNVLEKVC